jgi:hypothetical protein
LPVDVLEPVRVARSSAHLVETAGTGRQVSV